MSILFKRILIFFIHFVSSSALTFLCVFLIIGLLGKLFVPDFQVLDLISHYVYYQLIYLGICLISMYFGCLIPLIGGARSPTEAEKLILLDAFLRISSGGDENKSIGVSVIDDEVNAQVFVLKDEVCLTTAMLRKTTRKELRAILINGVGHFTNCDLRFSILLYCAHLPYELVSRVLKFIIFVSRSNKVSNLISAVSVSLCFKLFSFLHKSISESRLYFERLCVSRSGFYDSLSVSEGLLKPNWIGTGSMAMLSREDVVVSLCYGFKNYGSVLNSNDSRGKSQNYEA